MHINNQSIVAITGSTANYLNKVIFNSVILKYQNNFYQNHWFYFNYVDRVLWLPWKNFVDKKRFGSYVKLLKRLKSRNSIINQKIKDEESFK